MTQPASSTTPSAPSAPTSAVARLLRPATAAGPSDVSADQREHAAEVVAHLLHRECVEWTWTAHRPQAHREEALRIVGALCREGWGPRSSAA